MRRYMHHTELPLGDSLEVKEAQGSQAIVHGDDDRVGEVGHEVSLVESDVRAALVIASAVDEEHDWKLVGIGRREDVEVQAVFALHGRATEKVRKGRGTMGSIPRARGKITDLRTARRVLLRQTHTRPRSSGDRLLPAHVAHRRGGVGDTWDW